LGWAIAGLSPAREGGVQGHSLRKARTSPHISRVTFLITFTCYGSPLPGDSRGSCDHVRKGERRLLTPFADCESQANALFEEYRRRQMRQPPYILSTEQSRALVRDAVVNVCPFRAWFLYALHVRTNHLHGIVEADDDPSRVMKDWKAYATRSLRSAGLAGPDRLVWTHGGNARRIASPDGLRQAMRYVLEGQGDPLECYYADQPR
jgi:REP element-mobilizing transposase RayT